MSEGLVLTPPDVEPALGPKSDPNPMVRAWGLGPVDTKCGKCLYLTRHKMAGRPWSKCELRKNTGGRASDHRTRWSACAKFERSPDAD